MSSNIKIRLILKAVEKYGNDVYPNFENIDDCFTTHPELGKGLMYFYFNTPDKSTHMVTLPMEADNG